MADREDNNTPQFNRRRPRDSGEEYNKEISSLLSMIEENQTIERRLTLLQLDRSARETSEAFDRLIEEVDYTNTLLERLTNDEFNEMKDTYVSGISDSAFDGLMSRLKGTTIDVRVRYAVSDLIIPFFQEYEAFRDEEKRIEEENRRREMMIRLLTLNAMDSNHIVGRKLYLTMQNFTQMTAWSSLSMIANSLSSLGRGIWSFLFGNKKEYTLLEKINKGVREQTEFLMSGKIQDEERGFFKTFFEKGLIGGLASNLARGGTALLGMGRSRAQEIEDKRSRGEELTLLEKISGSIATSQHGVDAKGRVGGLLHEGKSDRDSKVFEPIIDILKTIPDIFNDRLRRIEYVLVKNFNLLFDRSIVDERKSLENLSSIGDAIDLHYNTTTGQFELDEEKFEEMNKQSTIMEKILKTNKQELRETKKISRQLFTQKLMSFAGGIFNLGKSIVGTILLAIGPIVGRAIAGITGFLARSVAGPLLTFLGPAGTLAGIVVASFATLAYVFRDEIRGLLVKVGEWFGDKVEVASEKAGDLMDSARDFVADSYLGQKFGIMSTEDITNLAAMHREELNRRGTTFTKNILDPGTGIIHKGMQITPDGMSDKEIIDHYREEQRRRQAMPFVGPIYTPDGDIPLIPTNMQTPREIGHSIQTSPDPDVPIIPSSMTSMTDTSARHFRIYDEPRFVQDDIPEVNIAEFFENFFGKVQTSTENIPNEELTIMKNIEKHLRDQLQVLKSQQKIAPGQSFDPETMYNVR